MNTGKRGQHSLLLLFLFSFFFRLIYIVESTANPLFGVPLVDGHEYASWADRIISGHCQWYQVGNYLPVYPAFLALLKLLCANVPLFLKMGSALLGSLACVLVASLAARAWDRRTGLLAGYLAATTWLLVVYEAEPYAEAFSILCLLTTLWILATDWKRPLVAAAIAGVAFALCAGARANLLLLLPFLAGWLLTRRGSPRGTATLVFLAAPVLFFGSVAARNAQLTGSPMLRAQASWSFYSAVDPAFAGLHPPAGIAFQKYMREPFRAGLHSEAEVEAYWANKAKDVVRREPLAVVRNLAERCLMFLNAREWSQEFDVYEYRRYSPFLSLPWPGFWLIGPLGLLALITLRKPSPNQTLLAICLVVSMISIIPFKISDRYRLPSVMLMIPFAAAAVFDLGGTFRSGNWRRAGESAVLLGLLCLLIWPDWTNLRGRRTARTDFFVGLHFEESGQPLLAIPFYRASMEQFSWDADSPYRIGHILLGRGQPGAAQMYLDNALRREPDFAEASVDLAVIDLRNDRPDKAFVRIERALDLDPYYDVALVMAGRLCEQRKDNAAAAAYYRRAIADARESTTAMMAASRLEELGFRDDAVKYYMWAAQSPRVDPETKKEALRRLHP